MDKQFNSFWCIYAKKRGKQATLKQWDKLDAIDRQMVLDHVSKFVKENPDPKFRPDPERYLKHRRFEDEIASETPQEASHPSHKPFVPPTPEIVYWDDWADWFERKVGIRPQYPTPEELEKGKKELGE